MKADVRGLETPQSRVWLTDLREKPQWHCCSFQRKEAKPYQGEAEAEQLEGERGQEGEPLQQVKKAGPAVGFNG